MNIPRLSPLLVAVTVAAASLLLGGCGTLVSNVTTFHNLPEHAALSGSVYVRTSGGGSDLETESYRTRVYAALGRIGLARTENAKGADYSAVLSYSIDEGKKFTFSQPIYAPVWEPTYHPRLIPTRHGYVYVNDFYPEPVYDVVGYQQGTGIAYTRTATLKLVRAKSGATVWEGRNRSTGPEGEISAVLPGMIDAMVRDFPGTSGKTRVIQGSAQ
ncbi:protein of unknown function [Verrucomicrobium sp. GAS474]|uniref:DUF4136 domain-containing protein n=1 Tax=Verrucomicrobium sp. GAS474 TaxID=1882831 RepID=UPI00087BD503|nr:DUF4136 domain-containing protein [Verrucomicrobium sp. GAS474]SDT87287.1 protein of unknown function [Verrucomicrobium sp. GAS474]